MPTESILFAPEIDERQLDRETDQVNDQLAGVGQDVPVSFDADTDGLTPAGAGRGGGGGMGTTAAAYGAGKSGGMSSLASKIPKPVAGVTAAAALPIALTGAVGVGLLSEMGKASARMQTSARILGIARDNFFREPGNIFDQFITRPLSEDILGISQDFDDGMRSLGDEFRSGGMLPDDLDGVVRRLRAGADVFNALPGIGTVQAVGTGLDFVADQLDKWPGWPDITGTWPEWPEIGEMWPGWPSIDTQWPGWPSIGAEWPGWPDIGTPSWPSANMILNQFPSLDTDDLKDAILGDGSRGGGGSSGGGGGGGGWLPDFDLPFLDGGGRVQRTGAAVVHRNEIVADPDRLVSELASAVSQSTGRRTRSMDTGGLERRLDRLHDDLRRLESALSVEVQIGDETVARAASNGRRNRISDSNPRV